ncbi:MAG: glycerophosphodiester phosphodiesterase [Christensenellaceae bacterium]|jgi:glycerophosphoryl diester phosphodiesterase|nr:glycerophosphodiester phosphodiesterase [Christensenellaceae bacterium]
MKRIASVFLLCAILIVSCSFVGCTSAEELPFRQEQTKFIAHRGLSSVYPDNTIESFTAAGGSDFFWGIETDVWYIGDTFYLSHDWPEYLFGLPTLEDYLPICKSHGKTAVIDIKSNLTFKAVQDLLNLTAGYDVMFIDFKENDLRMIKSLSPRAHVQLLSHDYWPANHDFDVSLDYPALTRGVVNNAKIKNKEIATWTVNSKEEAQAFVDIGVDYVTTDCIFF